MSTYRKIKLAKTQDGIVPYISYYTDKNVNDGDLTVNTEDEDFDYETDYDYEPGINVPAYGDYYRHELPQIDFPLFFNKMGPEKFSRRKIPMSELTPSQCEFSEKKVIDIIRENDDVGPILISKDNKIIDGHHRWLAAVNMGHSDIEANQIDMDFQDVMKALDDNPEVAETKTVYESVFMEAEYKGRKVTLNKPFRTPDGPKKSAVYVKNKNGKVIIVRFGDKNMSIKKNIPARRKSFRARHNCSTAKDKTSARFWSCRAW